MIFFQCVCVSMLTGQYHYRYSLLPDVWMLLKWLEKLDYFTLFNGVAFEPGSPFMRAFYGLKFRLRFSYEGKRPLFPSCRYHCWGRFLWLQHTNESLIDLHAWAERGRCRTFQSPGLSFRGFLDVCGKRTQSYVKVTCTHVNTQKHIHTHVDAHRNSHTHTRTRTRT